MANPQVENGFVRIARELFDALCRVHLNGQEWRIVMAVVRKTYGFQKTSDVIPLSQFGKLTGMNRKSVCRTLKGLRFKNVILAVPQGQSRISPVSYSLNKDYTKWIGVIQPLANSGETASSASGETASSASGETATSASGETATSASVNAPHSASVKPMCGGSGETDTFKRHKDKRQGIFNLLDEINGLKKLDWDDAKIKKHLLMREVPEADIDKAFGKQF